MPEFIKDDGLLCWPHWMPIPEKKALGYSLQETNTRTEMDIGAIVRAKFKTDQTDFSCQIIMRDCEIEWLEAFEAELLNQGSVWFLMPIWVAGDVRHYTVQFTERPKVSQVKGEDNWLDFKIRIKNRLLAPIDGIEYGDRNTLVEWPSNLPVLQNSYSYAARKTDMKGGTELPTARRPQFNIDEVEITAEMSLSMSQIVVFEWFEREILNRGGRWFKMPVWIGGSLKVYKVRFKTRPKMTLDGFWTNVSLQMELEQREFMHPTVVQWLQFLSPEEVFYFLDEFHPTIHTSMPGLTIIPDGVYIKV